MSEVVMHSSPARSVRGDEDSMLEDREELEQHTEDIDMAVESQQHTYNDEMDSMAADETDLPATGAHERADTQMDDGEMPSGFRSPPHVQTWDEGKEVQAMGHGDAAEGIDEVDRPLQDETQQQRDDTRIQGDLADAVASAAMETQGSQHTATTITGPDSAVHHESKDVGHHQHAVDGDSEDVLVTQDQDNEDGTRVQDQAIEKRGENSASLTTHQSMGEKGHEDEQRTRIDVKQVEDAKDGTPQLSVKAEQQNHADDSDQHRKINQVNEVHIHRGDDCGSATFASGPLKRPHFDKKALANVRFTDDDDGEDVELLLRKPPICLRYWDTVYRLFRPVKEAAGEELETTDQHTVLLSQFQEKTLYFGQLEHLFAALHDVFPTIDEEGSILILTIPALDMTIREDSVYSRELSLYDIDRIFVGAGVPGDLELDLKDEAGLVSRFNALTKAVEERLSNLTTDEQLDDDDDISSGLGADTIAELGGEPLEDLDDVQLDDFGDGAIDTTYEVAAEDHVEPAEVLESADLLDQGAQDDDQAVAPLGEEGGVDGPDDGADELPEGAGADLAGDAFDAEESVYADAVEAQDDIHDADSADVTNADGKRVRRSSRLSAKADAGASASPAPQPSSVGNGDATASHFPIETVPLANGADHQRPASPKRLREADASEGAEADALHESKRPRAS